MGKSISEIKKNLKIPMKIAGRNSAVFMSRIPGSVCRIWRHVTAKKQAALVQERERLKQMHFYEEKV